MRLATAVGRARAWSVGALAILILYGAGPVRAASIASVPDAAVRSGDPVDDLLDRLDDPDARLDIADVRAPQMRQRFRRRSDSPTRCRWYRIRLSPTLLTSGPWVLQAAFESATLFEPSDANYRAEAFGERTPVASRRLRNGLVNVDLPAADFGRDLYLRVDGQSTPSITFATAAEVATFVQRRDLHYTFYIAVYFVLAFTAFLFAVATRAKAFGYYALYIAMQGVLKICYLPYAARSIWPHLALESVVVDAAYGFLSPAAYFLFLRYALETRTWLRADRFVVGCAIASAVFISSCYVIDDVTGAALYATVVPLFFVATLLAGVTVTWIRWRQHFVSAGFYLVGMLALLVGVLAYPFAHFDTADIGFTLEAFAFLAALAFRLVAMTDERQRALMETLAAREATEAETAKRMAATEIFNAAFARFVPREFLVQLGRSDVRDVALGDHVEREMTVMFCDIRSFVSLAERMTPEAMFRFLNVYFGRIGPIIRKHGGFIDKYLGDGVMALFSGESDGALQAAVELHAEVRRINEIRAREGERPFEVGVGLHRGPTILATIGEMERFDTTVVADVVNLASRLEGMTGLFGARIIASDAVVSSARDIAAFNRRWLGEIVVQGSTAPLSTFEVCDGDPAELLLHKRATARTFAEALSFYRRGDYSTSRMLFEQLTTGRSDDRVAAYFAERSRQRAALVDAAWDGIERQQFKN